MTNQILLLIVLLCMINMITIVESFPGGTGSCNGGQAAVGGSHLTAASITNTSLADQSVTLLMNGVALTPGVRAFFEVGNLYTMELTSSTSTMKGCFIRFSVPTDVSKDVMIVTADENTQTTPLCASDTTATGVTHTDSNDKAVCSCTILLTTAAFVTVDVTIVIENDSAESIYAYNQFISGSETGSPTTSPAPIVGGGGGVVTPTTAPVVGGAVATPSPSPTPIMVGGPAGVLPPSMPVSDSTIAPVVGGGGGAVTTAPVVGGTVVTPTPSPSPIMVGGPAGVLPPSMPVSDSSDVPTLTPVIGAPVGSVEGSDIPTKRDVDSSDVPTKGRGDIMTTAPGAPTVPTAMAPAVVEPVPTGMAPAGSTPTASAPTGSAPTPASPTGGGSAPSAPTSSAFTIMTTSSKMMMSVMISMFIVVLSTQF